jgi:hypothetical protein
MPRSTAIGSTAMISSFRNPVDQLINVAALMHGCQTRDDVERRWPQMVATLRWVAKRRQLTYDHLIAAVDWLIAAAHSGPFAGEQGEPYRAEVEQLIGAILGKAPPPPWITSDETIIECPDQPTSGVPPHGTPIQDRYDMGYEATRRLPAAAGDDGTATRADGFPGIGPATPLPPDADPACDRTDAGAAAAG